MNDWMNRVRSPTRYRVGGSNIKLNFKINGRLVIIVLLALFGLVFVVYMLSGDKEPRGGGGGDRGAKASIDLHDASQTAYNSIYPLTPPFVDERDKSKTYKVALVSDLDQNSKVYDTNKYVSYLLTGYVKIFDDHKRAEISFDRKSVELHSQYSFGDRGMELSELVVFNGKLYSCDDRTGIVYEVMIESRLVVPWAILVDGDGRNQSKGFKCEWMTVKDNKLYVGGLGKEWTTPQGELVNHNPQWIKIVSHTGAIQHVDWTEKYNKIRSESGYSYPGYMIFESAAWSHTESKWYFLPRRASQQRYDEKLDEQRATNLIIKADQNFRDISIQHIGTIIPTRGYSSFKFVPNTDQRLILAIKSEEDDGKMRTYITLFTTSGFIIVQDQIISDKYKYEGIEFI